MEIGRLRNRRLVPVPGPAISLPRRGELMPTRRGKDKGQARTFPFVMRLLHTYQLPLGNLLSFCGAAPYVALRRGDHLKPSLPSLGVSSLDLGRHTSARPFFWPELIWALFRRLAPLVQPAAPAREAVGHGAGDDLLERQKSLMRSQAGFIHVEGAIDLDLQRMDP